jgi:hypothetical protein
MPSKWLTWTPKAANGADVEPSKPTRPTFDGFVGGPGYTFQKIEDGPRVFPHCPRCASYALYRKNNIGNYECDTCGLIDISETAARRIQ